MDKRKLFYDIVKLARWLHLNTCRECTGYNVQKCNWCTEEKKEDCWEEEIHKEYARLALKLLKLSNFNVNNVEILKNQITINRVYNVGGFDLNKLIERIEEENAIQQLY